MKTCSKCKIEKDLIEFSNQKGGVLNKRPNCKSCKSNQDKQWRLANQDKIKEKQDTLKNNNKFNKECYIIQNETKLKEKYIGIEFGSYRVVEYLGRLKSNNSKFERYYFKKVCKFCGSESNSNTLSMIKSQIVKKPKCNLCKESINIHKKERKCACCNFWMPATSEFFPINKDRPFGIHYYCKNCKRNKAKHWRSTKENNYKENKYIRERRQTDPLFKLTCNIRCLIRSGIRNQGYTKRSKTHQILGCDFETFKAHLQKQFTEGMNWENQGQWHLDHIYPVSLARDEQHLIELNHYTNFQPLWAFDNLSKGNRVNFNTNEQ